MKSSPAQARLNFSLGEFRDGDVLHGYDKGEEACAKLLGELVHKEVGIIEFTGVRDVDATFLVTFLGGLHLAFMDRRKPMTHTKLGLTCVNDEVAFGLEVAAWKLVLPGVAYQRERGSRITLAAGYPPMVTTFSVAEQLTTDQGYCTAMEIAERLGITPQNATVRLKRLGEMGAAVRSGATVPGGGREFRYETLTQADIVR